MKNLISEVNYNIFENVVKNYHSDGRKYRGHEPDGVEDYPADWLWDF